MKLNKRISQIKDLALKEAELKDEFYTFACLTEEVGELAQDLVNDEKEHARLEALDCTLASIAMFYRLGGTDEEMDYRLKREREKMEN